MNAHKPNPELNHSELPEHAYISRRLLTKATRIRYTISWFAIVAQLDRAMVF